jgi:hypothetical protein
MSNLILDPATLKPATKREIVTHNQHAAKFAGMADRVFRQLHLTVVCTTCGATPQMANAPGDAMWRMECACATRVLRDVPTLEEWQKLKLSDVVDG